MDAITMESTSSLISKLTAQFPSLSFEASDQAKWSASTSTVYYVATDEPEAIYELLHELGHATLGHNSYEQDVELLTLERLAWDEAARIAGEFHLTIPEDTIEDHLDSYRDWLHARSRCPRCDQGGIQQKASGNYRCPLCHATWRVNEARTCGLKRYTQTKIAS